MWSYSYLLQQAKRERKNDEEIYRYYIQLLKDSDAADLPPKEYDGVLRSLRENLEMQ